MNLQFLTANERDIPIIFQQAKDLIDTYENIVTIAYEKVLAWVHQKITNEISSYTRVLLEGKTCGYFRLCEDGELDDLYVLKSFQNQGIGSAIMEKCIAESQNPIYLYVFSRNIRAISFYERFGFSVREKLGDTRQIMVRKG